MNNEDYPIIDIQFLIENISNDKIILEFGRNQIINYKTDDNELNIFLNIIKYIKKNKSNILNRKLKIKVFEENILDIIKNSISIKNTYFSSQDGDELKEIMELLMIKGERLAKIFINSYLYYLDPLKFLEIKYNFKIDIKKIASLNSNKTLPLIQSIEENNLPTIIQSLFQKPYTLLSQNSEISKVLNKILLEKIFSRLK